MSTAALPAQKFTVTRRIVYRCRACKAASRVDWTYTCCRQRTWDGYRDIDATWIAGSRTVYGTREPFIKCACGAEMAGKRLVANLHPETPCDARCTGAKGHVCECSCGGENHGKDNFLILA